MVPCQTLQGTFQCLFGKVEYQRFLCQNGMVRKSIGPIGEGLCLLVDRRATRLLVEMPLRTARDILDGFDGVSPGGSCR